MIRNYNNTEINKSYYLSTYNVLSTGLYKHYLISCSKQPHEVVIFITTYIRKPGLMICQESNNWEMMEPVIKPIKLGFQSWCFYDYPL